MYFAYRSEDITNVADISAESQVLVDKIANIKERILQLSEIKGVSKELFFKELGLTYGNFRGKSKDTPINSNALADILAKYPDVNPNWLILGQGSVMLSAEQRPIPESNAIDLHLPQPGYEHELELIKKEDSTEFRHLGDDQYLVICPLVEQYAYAGYVSGWSDPTYVDDLPRHTVTMKNLTLGVYRAFVVRGDSMDNGLRGSFADGDILTARKLYQKHWRNKLHIHQYKYFILVTAEGIQIKEITEHRVDEGVIVCHSLNPDKKKYPDFEMSLADVREIYYVKARTEPLD